MNNIYGSTEKEPMSSNYISIIIIAQPPHHSVAIKEIPHHYFVVVFLFWASDPINKRSKLTSSLMCGLTSITKPHAPRKLKHSQIFPHFLLLITKALKMYSNISAISSRGAVMIFKYSMRRMLKAKTAISKTRRHRQYRHC